MLLVVLPIIGATIFFCLGLKFHNNDDTLETLACWFAGFVTIAVVMVITVFLFRIADYDHYEVEMERAKIEYYIQNEPDDEFENIYNTVIEFNKTVYKNQDTLKSPWTNWFVHSWWADIEPIDWVPQYYSN